jgi:hypothetical protein
VRDPIAEQSLEVLQAGIQHGCHPGRDQEARDAALGHLVDDLGVEQPAPEWPRRTSDQINATSESTLTAPRPIRWPSASDTAHRPVIVWSLTNPDTLEAKGHNRKSSVSRAFSVAGL